MHVLSTAFLAPVQPSGFESGLLGKTTTEDTGQEGRKDRSRRRAR